MRPYSIRGAADVDKQDYFPTGRGFLQIRCLRVAALSLKPLIMLTNDDGIASPGLLALIHAVRTLGDLLVVAPQFQQSATSRSYRQQPGVTEIRTLTVDGAELTAYSIDATPAQTVRNGILR